VGRAEDQHTSMGWLTTLWARCRHTRLSQPIALQLSARVRQERHAAVNDALSELVNSSKALRTRPHQSTKSTYVSLLVDSRANLCESSIRARCTARRQVRADCPRQVHPLRQSRLLRHGPSQSARCRWPGLDSTGNVPGSGAQTLADGRGREISSASRSAVFGCSIPATPTAYWHDHDLLTWMEQHE
jgi:hypothetical protein